MISFKRDGKTVSVESDTDLPHEIKDRVTIYVFSYQMDSVQSAELLCRYLTQRLGDRIAAIRQEEFRSGWRHAKAKKRGLSFFKWFYRSLTSKPSHGKGGA